MWWPWVGHSEIFYAYGEIYAFLLIKHFNYRWLKGMFHLLQTVGKHKGST